MVYRSAFVPALEASSMAGSLKDAATLIGAGVIRVHHVVDLYRPPVTMAEVTGVAAVVDAQRDTMRELEKDIRAAFDSVAPDLDKSVEVSFTAEEGEMPRAAAQAGRVADVLVFRSRSNGKTAFDPPFLEELLFHSGRPLFLTPASGLSKRPEHIAIGWNGTREAARAMSMAGPLIDIAEKVSVLTIGKDRRDSPTADQVAAHLSHCRVNAHVLRREAKGDTGEALADLAIGAGCDALVMGAFSHSRLREVVLGGVTRAMLDQPPMPLLLAC